MYRKVPEGYRKRGRKATPPAEFHGISRCVFICLEVVVVVVIIVKLRFYDRTIITITIISSSSSNNNRNITILRFYDYFDYYY